MPSTSQTVRRLIDEKPIVYESLAAGIVSHAALAEKLKPEIELEMGTIVTLPAIVMAIRRYAEKLSPDKNQKIPFKFNSEIVMKTGLCDITLVKSPSALSKLKSIYNLIDYERGDTLNIIQGNYEVTIVINDKYEKRILNLFSEEKVLNVEHDLVSLTTSFSKDFLYTPGILATVTRKLFWENINVFENISTMTELIFIISKKDAVRAYKIMQEMIDKNKF